MHFLALEPRPKETTSLVRSLEEQVFSTQVFLFLFRPDVSLAVSDVCSLARVLLVETRGSGSRLPGVAGSRLRCLPRLCFPRAGTSAALRFLLGRAAEGLARLEGSILEATIAGGGDFFDAARLVRGVCGTASPLTASTSESSPSGVYNLLRFWTPSLFGPDALLVLLSSDLLVLEPLSSSRHTFQSDMKPPA